MTTLPCRARAWWRQARYRHIERELEQIDHDIADLRRLADRLIRQKAQLEIQRARDNRP